VIRCSRFGDIKDRAPWPRASLRSNSPPIQQKGAPFIPFFHSQPALGARRLAELLAELSTADPVVRKAAKLALAAGQSPAKLLAEIDKRIRTTACSKTLINWDRREPLVQELEKPADHHYRHPRPPPCFWLADQFPMAVALRG
jgi:hypothetical protein